MPLFKDEYFTVCAAGRPLFIVSEFNTLSAPIYEQTFKC